MEPKGSLPHSQEPATCPYLESDQSCFLNIYFNTVLPPASRSSKLSITLRYPNQTPSCTLPVLHTCHVIHLILPDLIIWTFGQDYKSRRPLLPVTCYLRPNYPPQRPILKHAQPVLTPVCVLRKCERPAWHTAHTTWTDVTLQSWIEQNLTSLTQYSSLTVSVHYLDRHSHRYGILLQGVLEASCIPVKDTGLVR
jgi:hypothetical protein